MCGTPAVSIPVWLGTGSAQVGTDGIGPEANLANEATAGKARSCSPAFVGCRFCFPHRRPKEAREGTGAPPSAHRVESGAARRAGQATHRLCFHWMIKVPKRYTRS